jgi:hypothetical protein
MLAVETVRDCASADPAPSESTTASDKLAKRMAAVLVRFPATIMRRGPAGRVHRFRPVQAGATFPPARMSY